MPVIARTNAPRPPRHGRVVEIHNRPGLRDTYDLRIIIWSPTFGVHGHTLTGVHGKTRAYQIAEHIGQATVRAAHQSNDREQER